MKKALIIEDPSRHRESIIEPYKEFLKAFNYESENVFYTMQAKSRLESGVFQLVVIHHYDFFDVTYLRENFPNLKFIGYTANFEIYSDAEKGTIGADFCTSMREKYDYVICTEKSFPEILRGL